MATAAIMMGEMNGQQLLQAEHSSVLLIFLMSKFFNDFQSICARRMLSKRSINLFFLQSLQNILVSRRDGCCDGWRSVTD